MKKTLLSCSLLLLTSAGFSVQGKTIICKSGNVERTIEIAYTSPNTTLPCSVNYKKTMEDGGDKMGLYSAQNLDGFCEQKAQELQGKLEGSGFSCTAMGEATTTTPAPTTKKQTAKTSTEKSMPPQEENTVPQQNDNEIMDE